ncbi:hypothetical protein LTR95_009167 [Oleoguttula sp. CCFEE 5521]
MTDRSPQDLPLGKRRAVQTSTNTAQDTEVQTSTQNPAGTGVSAGNPTPSSDVALPPGFGNRGSLPEGSPNGGYDQSGPLHYPPLPEGWREQDLSPSEAAAAPGDVTTEQTSVAMLPIRENADQSSGRQATAPPASRQAAQPKRICSRTIAGFYPNGGHDPGGPLWVTHKSDAGDQAAGPASGSADCGKADGAALPNLLEVPEGWRAAEGWPNEVGEDADQAADRMDDD